MLEEEKLAAPVGMLRASPQRCPPTMQAQDPNGLESLLGDC
jgi:hypothetical protein